MTEEVKGLRACQEGMIEEVKRLLDEGMDPDTMVFHIPLLSWACLRGRLEVVRVLLHAGASVNPNTTSWPPVLSACKARNLPLVRLLLEAGADPNASLAGWTALMEVEKNCDSPELAQRLTTLLLARGAIARKQPTRRPVTPVVGQLSPRERLASARRRYGSLRGGTACVAVTPCVVSISG